MTTETQFPLFAQFHSQTSVAAAIAIQPRAEHDREKILKLLKSLGGAGATDEEMQDDLKMQGSTQRPRRIELVEDRLVVNSGRTRKTKSGRDATIWVHADFSLTTPTATKL